MSQYYPQDDFYMYVNHKWLEDPNNKIPDDYSRWGGFVKLDRDSKINQIELVKQLYNKKLNEEEQKILAIWEASNSRFKRWENNNNLYEILYDKIRTLDFYLNGDKTYAERIASYYFYSELNGINNVLSLDVSPDLENSNNMVLVISICGLSLPSRDYYMESNFKDKFNEFREHLHKVYKIVNNNIYNLDDIDDIDNNFVENVLEFEKELAYYTMKSNQNRKYVEYYTNTNLTDMYKKIDELKSLKEKENNYDENDKICILTNEDRKNIEIFFEKVYDMLDLRRIMHTNHYNNYVKTGILNSPDREHITVFDGDGLRRVLKMILNPEKMNKYRSYLQYKIIRSCSSICSKELNDEFFDFYNRRLYGQKTQKRNDARSIELVNDLGGEMMGRIYVEKYFPEENKKDVEHMIENIMDIMRESIRDNTWFNEKTKSEALKKLSKFRYKIGYPDVWENYSELKIKKGDSLDKIIKKYKIWNINNKFLNKINSVVDKNEWHMTPQTVNAYFSPDQNEIVFPAAIIQPPFYIRSSNDNIDIDILEEKKLEERYDLYIDIFLAINYGGIGSVISHEITHGYDDQGRLYDSDGNLHNWWTEEDVQIFNEKRGLIVEQVEKYKYIDTETGDVYNMNSELTMGENLADLGGLSLSIKALRKNIEETEYYNSLDNKKKEILMMIYYRIFFKSYANIWKEVSKKDKKINLLTTDPHAPSEFRGNLVKNLDEFYEVFDVKETDKMYISPNKRIRIF